ncbi:MAG: 23S rRNA (uracil(1939)-C(5))-methyltransferase RlmD [Candidatus Saganbacteria bacterium]|nr:23S rRNA (uracil(1939)-C(5))-methyltransferase RlmD [Candidatus Saganbacteria bacterium]
MAQEFIVTGLDDKGRGIAGGQFVKFAFPGDLIDLEPVSRRKKTSRLVRLIEPSPDRQEPPCQYFGRCGGCAWQGLKYQAQLKFKEARVRSLFGDALPIIPSPEEYYYRNRMDYAFGPDYSIGLKDGKFNIINIEQCLLMSEASNKILSRLRHFVSWKKLLHYKEGIMRHVVIREGKNINNMVLNVLTSDKGELPLEDLWEKLRDAVSGITWSINLSPADRSYGEIQKSFGQDHLIESLCGIMFKVPVQSFFQTNTHQAEKLLEVVRDFAGLQGGETLLDLFSGSGSIGLSLADRAKEVIGVEENEAAAKLSEDNARLNNINNFRSIAGRVEDILQSLEGRFETIILDPPRPGVHKKALQKIGQIKPHRIVYVSCNPETQAHDIKLLEESGYQVKRIQPLDMFPHTPHIENIILLKL